MAQAKNCPQMTTIKLYGALREFGREYQFLVGSTAEAVKALCIQIPGLERFFANAHLRGVEFAVFRGRRNIGEEEFGMGGAEEIRIAPILKGRKRGGLVQTIVGVALIALAYFNPFGAFSGPVVTGLYAAGAANVAGGVIQMLSPQAQGLKQSAAPENLPSYAFGSARNTTASGNPVPICYGKRRWGGAIISASIYAEDKT
ncbi:TPA: tail assembly protein [Pseudomonas aeruginosa]|uniref:tail assembly protein n=1 Tax=Pseudomonas aeruginosa TaxID=287 RepID=UPI002076B667|nr:tail assembly protein [Pseudomonas aeruginosa]MCM8572163.1 tail assembly protein [Pseudomonas aeruginosa]HDV4110488.1 tail assembly protein [Pseudomonas aeruginosa]HDV4164938.1 tail assembly protein [Pseudomonas aeruginosa]HDV4178079.1 tail assembly protein [Pseudomonas aeruginosa]HDV4189978.1 tail assembly protein [Pseudomonas aeruginosa]